MTSSSGLRVSGRARNSPMRGSRLRSALRWARRASWPATLCCSGAAARMLAGNSATCSIPPWADDAVRAVQRAALNVVQAQPALAVLDHLAGTRRQALDLFGVQQR